MAIKAARQEGIARGGAGGRTSAGVDADADAARKVRERTGVAGEKTSGIAVVGIARGIGGVGGAGARRGRVNLGRWETVLDRARPAGRAGTGGIAGMGAEGRGGGAASVSRRECGRYESCAALRFEAAAERELERETGTGTGTGGVPKPKSFSDESESVLDSLESDDRVRRCVMSVMRRRIDVSGMVQQVRGELWVSCMQVCMQSRCWGLDGSRLTSLGSYTQLVSLE
jgi:hypothetical protein